MLLDGKVAIITGAARGTGTTIARRFVEEGAKVVVADIREVEGQAMAQACGDAAYFQPLDVTKDANWDKAVATVLDVHGRIDVLVNNAAILHMGNLDHTTSDDFRRLFEVNALGAFAGIRAVVGPMRSGGGDDRQPGVGRRLRRTQWQQCLLGEQVRHAGHDEVGGARSRRDNIRVNTVCPAGGNAAMFAPWADQLAEMAEDSSRLPRSPGHSSSGPGGRGCRCRCLLASDMSRFVTGADVPVDGGQTAGHFDPASTPCSGGIAGSPADGAGRTDGGAVAN